MNTIRFHHCTRVSMGCDRILGRRDFLRGISTAALAAGTLSWTDQLTLSAEDLRRRGMSCILLWMQGGPSQFETFSPKPSHANGGETKAIRTRTAGLQIAESLPKLANISGDLAVIRSMTSKEGNHQRATHLLHTGYLPTPTVKFPSLGSTVSRELGDASSELPSYVRISSNARDGAGPGLLGVKYDPLELRDPTKPLTNSIPTTSVDRYKRRLQLLDQLSPQTASAGTSREVADHKELYDRASRMILSPSMKAFDLTGEPESMHEAYGKTQFGAGCLLARRLVESGVTFVEVGLGGWDTHEDNFARSKKLCGDLDQPMAQLIEDLKQRGRLDSTLVIWMGEFGRSPDINPRAGRGHFPLAFNVVLAGGGIRGGQVIGESDAGGYTVKNRPVTVPDLYQSFCKSLRINAAKENMSPLGRPIKIVDGGKPVAELFS